MSPDRRKWLPLGGGADGGGGFGAAACASTALLLPHAPPSAAPRLAFVKRCVTALLLLSVFSILYYTRYLDGLVPFR